jgi:DNA-binding response OmpR family regulator
MKILVVDDSTINNILLQNYLEENNFDVVTALNGPDAIDIIRKDTIDLVLLDVMMPEFSGFDFLKYLKTNNLSVPVIIITANADMEYKEQSFALGAKEYLNKPIQFIELKDKITRVLQIA